MPAESESSEPLDIVYTAAAKAMAKNANDTVLTSFGLRIARRPRAESRF